MPKYCLKCMQEVKDAKVCPHCGASLLEVMENPAHALPVGSVLNGRYMVGSIIGQGGFGITYIGLDQLLGMRVAIKEYFPSGHVNRNTQVTHQITCSSERQKQFLEKGKKRFLQEAKVLASFHGINGVVDVRDFFELNDTAYIIMEYLDGEDLRSYLERNRFTSDEIFGLMEPIFRALREIHKKGIVHRDISPDNIMMMKDGTLKLMDFGAARFSNAEDDHSVSIMLKNGYAPEEQYRSKGKQGPWTDIYALCATIYKCITGIKIDDALDRMADDRIKWPSELGYAISEEQESVLKKGLKVFARDRIQSLDELIEMLRTEGRTTTDEDSRTASAEEQLRDDAKITEEIHSEEELTVYEEIKKTVTEGDREKTVAEETGEVTVYEERKEDFATGGTRTEEGEEENADINDFAVTSRKKDAELFKRGKVGIISFFLVLLIGFISLCVVIQSMKKNVWPLSETQMEDNELIGTTPNTITSVEYTDSMLWGMHSMLSEEMPNLEFSHIVIVNSKEMVISSFPVVIEGFPSDSEKGTEAVFTFYTDQWDKVRFEGTYHVDSSERLSFDLVSIVGGERVAEHEPIEYKLSVSGDAVLLLTQNASHAYYNELDYTTGCYCLKGEINEGDITYKGIESINIAMEGVDVVGNADGNGDGVIFLQDEYKKVSSSVYDDDLVLLWETENGDEESLHLPRLAGKDIDSSFAVINTFPYGFIIVDNERTYCYQKDAYDYQKKYVTSRSKDYYESQGYHATLLYSYEALTEACDVNKDGWEENVIYYLGKEPLVIQENLALDASLYTKSSIIVPEGVTLRENSFLLSVGDMVVDGQVICSDKTALSVSSLAVTGNVITDNLCMRGSNPRQVISGKENITYSAMQRYWFRPAFCEPSLANIWFDRARSGNDGDMWYVLDIDSDGGETLIMPDTLPSSVSALHLHNTDVIVPYSSYIDSSGLYISLYYGSKLTIEGLLSGADVFMFIEDEKSCSEQFVVRNTGAYQGSVIVANVDESFDVSQVLSGLTFNQNMLKYDEKNRQFSLSYS